MNKILSLLTSCSVLLSSGFKRRILLLLTGLVASSFGYAESSVWKVEMNGSHFYLGGTIHMLSESDYPLPSEFNRAFTASDKVIFETDVSAVSSAEMQQYMLSKTIYPQGTNISDFLKPETYDHLSRFFKNRGLNLEQLPNFKVGMLSITMSVLEMQRMGMADMGVDSFFHLRAISGKKTIEYFETPQQQVDFLAKLGDGAEEQLIQHTLKEMNEFTEVMRITKHAWRVGDLKMMDKELLLPLKRDFPDIHDALLVDRNNQWMNQISKYTEDDDVEFVMVGALHLVGDDGLLSQLKSKGAKIIQLQVD